MLNYLVTSKTRLALLKLLWLEGRSGTVHQLAQKAGVAFSGAYRELKAMAAAGLAKVEWRNGKKYFLANNGYPGADVLRKLLNQPKLPEKSSEEEASLRANLVSLGLPVLADTSAANTPPRAASVERTLVEAVLLSERDASVARALPVLFARVADRLDYRALKAESRRAGNKRRVGFFLELTGKLGGFEEMTEAAENFFDRRCKSSRPYFVKPSKYSAELALKRTPDLAKKWGWTMNMGMDAFENTYRKFTHAAVSR